MPTTKTAISLDEELFEQAEAVAAELSIPRSRLFALALGEFLERHRNRKLLVSLDRAHGEEPSATEADQVRARRRSHRRQVEGTW